MQTPSGYKVKGVSFTQVFSCFVVVFFYNLPTNKFEHQSIFLVLLTNPMSCENSIKRVFDFRNPAQWRFWYDSFKKNQFYQKNYDTNPGLCQFQPQNYLHLQSKSYSNLLNEKKHIFGTNF